MKKGAVACFAGMLVVVGALLCIDSAPKQGGTADGDAAATNAAAAVDFDFTSMNATVRTAYAYRLGVNPREFEGKTVRISGSFLTLVDKKDGKRYFACMMGNSGGCACCAPGGVLEFEPKGSLKWPDDFPRAESRITVSGLLKLVEVEEDGQRYPVPRLFDADVLPL